MNQYRQSDIFICYPEKRTPALDPSILEQTDDRIPDKTQCENEVGVIFPSFIENAVTGASLDAFE